MGLHRRMAGVVVHITHALHAVELDAFFKQILVDVEQPAAGKDLVELVLLQLIHARAARHDDGLDIEVVERVRDAVEEHAVGGGDRLSFFGFTCRGLRIAAAQIARRQHRLRTGLEQHGLRCEPHLAEQPLRTAARKIEHRIGIVVHFSWIADDRHDARILDVEQRARGLLRQSARHRFVDEVNHLRRERRAPDGGRRMPGLPARETEGPCRAVGEPLRPVAPPDHQLAREVDGARVGGVEKQHGRERAGVESAFAVPAQEVAHGDRDVAEIDVDRARVRALVAHRAMIGDVGKLVEVLERDAAPRLLLVEEGLDQEARGEDLVARAVEQVRARHVGGAHRFALAAAQAVLD